MQRFKASGELLAHHQGEKGKAHSRFNDHQQAGQRGAGDDVAQPEGEEGGAAQVEVGEKSGPPVFSQHC